jgi:hypothetical protein
VKDKLFGKKILKISINGKMDVRTALNYFYFDRKLVKTDQSTLIYG